METGSIESRRDAKDNSPTIRDLSFSEILRVRSYRFFVVVRNPYSRVLSAFLNRFQIASCRLRNGNFELTPSGFSKFVYWLKDGGLSRDPHWDLQTNLLFMPLEKFDFVVRFENFKPDMLSFLTNVKISPPEQRLDGLYATDTNKKTSADNRLQEFYTPQLAAIIADIYAMDFETLNYSTVFPTKFLRN
ncbi:sulfotransferase family 2 domain-containing protein [Mesorhizobium marinum]|uniref:sulfotransferase family 2 domain-containing protein n=1 Tax=Mesorhizobium marinum TaxID=3228790 RepID=UPI003467C5A1